MVTTVADDGNGGFTEQQLPQCVDCPVGTYSTDAPVVSPHNH